MPAVLASAGIREPLASHLRKAERIVEFTIGKQPSIRGNHRTEKLEHQPAVEIEPENALARFTSRVRRDSRPQIGITF